MGIHSPALLPGSSHRPLPPSAPTNPLPGPLAAWQQRRCLLVSFPEHQMERKTQGGVSSRTKEMLRYRFCLRCVFLGGWGEIKQDLNTFTAPFPPHFPVNLLLSWYLSDDIFSFAFSFFFPSSPRIRLLKGNTFLWENRMSHFTRHFVMGRRAGKSDCVFEMTHSPL